MGAPYDELAAARDQRAPSAGFRNHLLNGRFEINQRGTSAFTTNNAFTSDRWLMGFNTGTMTVDPGAAAAGEAGLPEEFFRDLLITTAPVTNATSYQVLEQRMEDVTRLAGKTVCLSLWARVSAGTALLGAEIMQQFGSGGSPQVTGNTFQPQTVDTVWRRLVFPAITLPSVAGKTIGAGHLTDLLLWFSAGTSFAARSGGVPEQAKTFEITGVQLEVGRTPTEFELRPYGIELNLCRRYYIRLGNSFNGNGTSVRTFEIFGWGTQNGSTTDNKIFIPLPTPMRAIPTAAGNAGALRIVTGAASAQGVVAYSVLTNESREDLLVLSVISGAHGTSNLPAYFSANADSTAYISFSADL